VVSWTPRYRIRRYRPTHASVVGINAFGSRLLSSLLFVNGGDEGKSPSTDSSIPPTIVDTSTAVAAIRRGEYPYSTSELSPSSVNVSCSGTVDAAVEEEARYKLKATMTSYVSSSSLILQQLVHNPGTKKLIVNSTGSSTMHCKPSRWPG
jgi:hypothetical protein